MQQLDTESVEALRAIHAAYPLPKNYLTIDLETTGLSAAQDLVCVVGATYVERCVPQWTVEYWLDWTSVPDVDQAWLAARLNSVGEALQSRGSPFHHTYAALRRYGRTPEEVLTAYFECLASAGAINAPIVAHNGERFDFAFLQAAGRRCLGHNVAFGARMDTGAIEKAIQLGYDALPRPGEPQHAWSLRVTNSHAPGVYWALDRWCAPRYDLFARARAAESEAHSAGVDSLMLHFLVETYRSYVT